MRKTQAALVAAMLVAAAPVLADPGNGRTYAIYDRGMDSRGRFIGAQRFNLAEAMAYAHWLAGYITAYDHFKPDTADLLDLKSQDPNPFAGPLAWIEKWCTDHPMQLFMEAVDAFTDAQYPNRRRSIAPPK